jgi:O-antigen/teichoic acid export membrane protein
MTSIPLSSIPCSSREDYLLDSNTQAPVLSTVDPAEVLLNSTTVDGEITNEQGQSRSAYGKLALWVNKGGLALLDQGLASGSNFILSILLARWLSPEFYGAYAIAFGIYVLLGLVYGALVLEPMTVFGGASYRHCLRAYCGSLLWVHLAIASVVCLVVGCSAAVTHTLGWGGGLPGALLGIALASPFLLLLLFARRAFYLEMSPAQAATGSALYCGFMLSGLLILYRYTSLTPVKVFLLLGSAALLADILLVARLRSELPAGEPAPALKETWQRHWRYGRWALASCIATWTPTYIFYPLLSTFSGMRQSGELRALMNFFSPLDQTLCALSLVFLPYAARVHMEQGRKGLGILTRNLVILSVAGSAIYWGLIIKFHQPVFRLLYSGKYAHVAYLLPVLALGSLFWSASYGPAIALRAMESPASVFAAYFATTLISLAAGIPATRFYGLPGAVWASNAAEVASFLVIMFILRRKLAPAQKPLVMFRSSDGVTS